MTSVSFADRANPNTQPFIDAFVAKYGSEPGPFTNYAYDSTQNDVQLNFLGGLSLTGENHELKWTNLYVRNTTKEARSNKAPTLTLGPVAPIRLPDAATLVATASDDGLPVPRGRVKAAVGQETPPGLSGGQKEVPANLPWLHEEAARSADGLRVKWMVLRGPGDVHFEPADARPADGKATTTARFVEPGEYILRAAAQDGLLTTYRDVTVNVMR